MAERVGILHRRRAQADLIALGTLVGGPLSGRTLSMVSGLSVTRLYPALERLEASGRVESGWAPGPYPRRRVYRLAGQP